MPRVRTMGAGPPRRKPKWRELEDRIVDRYGMLLTTAQLGRVIGISNYDQIKTWAEGENIRPIPIGQRKKWDARDVAKAIDNAAFRA